MEINKVNIDADEPTSKELLQAVLKAQKILESQPQKFKKIEFIQSE